MLHMNRTEWLEANLHHICNIVMYEFKNGPSQLLAHR
jgi:hypothetical protein